MKGEDILIRFSLSSDTCSLIRTSGTDFFGLKTGADRTPTGMGSLGL